MWSITRLPPLGNGTLYEMPTYVDGLLMAEEAICFNAGTHRDVVHMRYDEFKRLVKPAVFTLSRAAVTPSGW